MTPEETGEGPPDRRSSGSSRNGRYERGRKSLSGATETDVRCSSAPGTMSTGWEGSEPATVAAGVYGPARMDQVHVRSRITGICWKCGEYVSMRCPTERNGNRMPTLRAAHIQKKKDCPRSFSRAARSARKVSESPTLTRGTRRGDPTETTRDSVRLYSDRSVCWIINSIACQCVSLGLPQL